MTIKEHNPANAAKDLEATQLVFLDDFKELEHLQLARADAAGPPRQRRTVMVAGIVFGLILAAALLLTALLIRSGGH